MKRIISFVVMLMFLVGLVMPMTASAYVHHNYYSHNWNAIWFQWTQNPASVQLGDLEVGEEYEINEKVPVSVIAEAIRLANRSYNSDNFSAYYDAHNFENNNLYKSGFIGLPYYESERTGQKPLWGDCVSLVKVWLRDYVGYAINSDRVSWADDDVWDNFAYAKNLPGAIKWGGNFLENRTHGAHQATLLPTKDDTAETRGYFEPKYAGNNAGFKNYLIQEENAGRLHIGALMFWSSTKQWLWEDESNPRSDTIHHVAIYVGGGKVMESVPTKGWCVKDAYQGAADGKNGMCKYYVNIDKPDTPKTGNFSLEKVSSVPGITSDNPCYSLEGATFELVKNDDSTVKYTLTTNAKGKASVEKIPIGNYTLKETKASKGFEINTKSFKITITGNNTTKQTVPETPMNDPAGITITKKDAQTSTAQGDATLEGAIYEVRYFDSTTADVNWSSEYTRHWFLETDSNGKADLHPSSLSTTAGFNSDTIYYDADGLPCLPLGTVLIKEVQAPEGYLLSDTVFGPYRITSNDHANVVVSDPQHPDEGVVANEQIIEGQFSIKKQEIDHGPDDEISDEDAHANAKPEAGIEFKVYNSSNEVVDTLITDENGIATSKVLPYGDYTVKQITEVYGNKKATDIHVNIPDDADKTFDIDNLKEYGKLRVIKTDKETGDVITSAGIKFNIFDADNNKVVRNGADVFATNADGEIAVSLPYGNYTIVEVETVAPYVLDSTPHSVTVDKTTLNDNNEVLVSVDNERVKAKITVEKKGLMITGAEEAEENGFTVMRPVRTMEALAGVKFKIVAREKIVHNGKTIYNKGQFVGTITTNAEGVATMKDMYLGSYTLTEAEAPEGYVVTINEDFDLTYAGQNKKLVTKDFSFENDLREMKVQLEKHAETMGTVTDSDGNVSVVYSYVAGAGFTFGLYNAFDIVNANTGDVVIPADSLVSTCVSDTNGLIVFTGKYPVGNYYVKEIATLPKYQVNDDFRYDINNKVEDESVPSIEFVLDEPVLNDYIYDMVKVTKTDITGGEGLPGATLEIRDSDDNVIYRNVTGEDGALDEVKLIPGDYFLIEVFAPNGYALSEEVVQFTVTEDGTTEGETTMKDDVTRFSFYKIDEKGKSLAGAEFTMYIEGEGEEPEVYAVVESDENGIVTFENLLVGKYIIKETKALPDYQLSSETIELEVTNEWLNSNSYTDGGELMFSIMNIPTIKTGRELSTGTIIAIVAGSVAVLGGIALIIIRKRKSK